MDDQEVIDYRIKYDEFGREIPDPTPIEIPVRLKGKSDPYHVDNVIMLIRREISNMADSQGHETLEESDDFDIDDEEGEFYSPYEFHEMQEEIPLEMREAEEPAPQKPALNEPTARSSEQNAPETKPDPGSQGGNE